MRTVLAGPSELVAGRVRLVIINEWIACTD